jgi:hypothetical protein
MAPPSKVSKLASRFFLVKTCLPLEDYSESFPQLITIFLGNDWLKDKFKRQGKNLLDSFSFTIL